MALRLHEAAANPEAAKQLAEILIDAATKDFSGMDRELAEKTER